MVFVVGQKGEKMTREEAMNVLKANYPDPCFSDLRKAVDMAIKALEQPEQKWIPVSEGLPEEGEKVLATHLGGINPNRQVIEHIYQCGKFTCGWDMDISVDSPTFGQRYMGEVIAWMPRPEPYQGESE